MRLIIFILLACLIFSCSSFDNEKWLNEQYFPIKDFTERILQNPDNIITIIDSSIHFEKSWRSGIIHDDHLRNLIPYLKKLTSSGYKYVYAHESITDVTNESVVCLYEIKAKSLSEDLFITFIFQTSDCQWKLQQINKYKFTFIDQLEYLPDGH